MTLLIVYELRKTIEKRRRVMSRWSSIVLSSITIPRVGTEFASSILTIARQRKQVISANSPGLHPVSQFVFKVEKDKLFRRSMVMCLWISIIFSIDRFLKAVNLTFMSFYVLSPFTFYLNAFTHFTGLFAASIFFFVYMNTSGMFRKKCYRIFLKKF